MKLKKYRQFGYPKHNLYRGPAFLNKASISKQVPSITKERIKKHMKPTIQSQLF